MGRFRMFKWFTRPLNTDPHLDGQTTIEPDRTISGDQYRVVRRMSSPTGTSRLLLQSIAHWGIIVGDPSSQDGVLTSEMVRNGDEVTHETTPHVTLPSANVKHAIVLGYTRMTDMEIRHKADAWIESHPTYSLRLNNCQHFARDLAEAIVDPAFGVDPNSGVRYRFKGQFIKFLGTVLSSGIKPGWIMPTKDKILVNVKETNDADTWIGQVDGTEDFGRFYKWSVKRVH